MRYETIDRCARCGRPIPANRGWRRYGKVYCDAEIVLVTDTHTWRLLGRTENPPPPIERAPTGTIVPVTPPSREV